MRTSILLLLSGLTTISAFAAPVDCTVTDEKGTEAVYSLVHERSSSMEGSQPTIRFYLKDSKPGLGDAYAEGHKAIEDMDSKFVESWSGQVMNATSQSFTLKLDAEGKGEYELTIYSMSIGHLPAVEKYTVSCAL